MAERATETWIPPSTPTSSTLVQVSNLGIHSNFCMLAHLPLGSGKQPHISGMAAPVRAVALKDKP